MTSKAGASVGRDGGDGGDGGYSSANSNHEVGAGRRLGYPNDQIARANSSGESEVGFGTSSSRSNAPTETSSVGAFCVYPSNPYIYRRRLSAPHGTTRATEAFVRDHPPFEEDSTVYAVAVAVETAAITHDVPRAPSSDKARSYTGFVRDIISYLSGVPTRECSPTHGDRSGFASTMVLAGNASSELRDVASLVAQDPTTLEVFLDGVAWASVGSDGASGAASLLPPTPVSYRDILLTICSQLTISGSVDGENSENVFGTLVRVALEGFAFGGNPNDEEEVLADFRRLKFIFAPHVVNRRILIILDGVVHSHFFELFSFGRAEGVPHRVLATVDNYNALDDVAPSAIHIVDINSEPSPPSQPDDIIDVGLDTFVTTAHVAPPLLRISSMSASIPHDVPLLRHAMLTRDGPIREVIGSLLLAYEDDVVAGASAMFPPMITMITGMGGLGKSTVASRVVHDPSVLASFFDGVAWISIGSTLLTPLNYRDHLLTICWHLSLTDRAGVAGLQSSLERFELDTANNGNMSASQLDLRRLHSLYKTFIAKKKILLVLDDVWHQEDLHLFSSPRMEGSPYRILVTTRRPAIVDDIEPSHIRCIALDLLSDAESTGLLAAVSGQGMESNHRATDLVRLCGNLPLALSSVAILIKGSRFCPPMPISAVIDLLSDSSDIRNTSSTLGNTFNIFDRSFGVFGDTADSVRICFATFCCCFATEHTIRPLIPRGAAECLFDAILLGYGKYLDKRDRALLIVLGDQQQSAATQIIDKLISIDMINGIGDASSGAAYLRINHDLHYDFGVQTAIALERVRSKRYANQTTEQLKESCMIRANAVLLRGYNEDRAAPRLRRRYKRSRHKDCWDNLVGDERVYVLKNLFLHLMRADKEAKARTLLSSTRFVRARFEAFGILDSIVMLNQESRMIYTPRKMGWGPPASVQSLQRYDQEFLKRYVALVNDPPSSKNVFLDYFIGRVHFLSNNQSWLLEFAVTFLLSRNYVFVLARKESATERRNNIMQCISAGYKEDDPYILYCEEELKILRQDFDGALTASDRLHHKIQEMTEDFCPARDALIRRTVRPHICLCAGYYDRGIAYIEECLQSAEPVFDTCSSAIAGIKYNHAELLRMKVYNANTPSPADKERALALFHEARTTYDHLGFRDEVQAIDKRIASFIKTNLKARSKKGNISSMGPESR